MRSPTASERRGSVLERFKGFDRKAKALAVLSVPHSLESGQNEAEMEGGRVPKCAHRVEIAVHGLLNKVERVLQAQVHAHSRFRPTSSAHPRSFPLQS